MNILFKILITSLFLITANTLFAQTDKEYQQWEEKLNKGVEFYKSKEYNKAEKPLENAYEIAQEIFSSYNKQFEKNINYLTRTYWNLNKYDKLPPILNWQIDEIKRIKGDDIKNYHFLVNNLGVVYKMLKDYEKAEHFQLATFEYSMNVEGKESTNYKKRLINIFKLYYETDNYEKSIPLNIEILKLTENDLGKEHKQYIRYLDNLALSYFDIKNYNEARFCFKQLQDIYKKIGDTNSKDYLGLLGFLGICNERLGNYNEGLKNHLDAIELSKIIYGENHEYYLNKLVHLGHFYRNFGKYAKALETFEDSLELIVHNLGDENELYAEIIHKLGALYIDLGELGKARQFFEQSISLTENIHGKNNSNYINRLGDLGLVKASEALKTPSLEYLREKAIKTYEEAIRLCEINDLKDVNYSAILSNLGNLYLNFGDCKKALSYYLKAQSTNQVNHLENDDILLNNLAGAYNCLNNKTKALELYEKSLKITKVKYGVNNVNYRVSLENIAYFYETQKQFDKAKPYVLEANSILIKEIEEIFKFRNQKDKKTFLKTILDSFEDNQEFGYLSNFEFDDINEMNLNNQLMLKGLLLNNSIEMFSELRSLNDKSINAKINKYKDLNKKLNDLTLLMYPKYYGERLEYMEQIPVLETELVKIHTESFNNKRMFFKDWRNIKKELNPNAIAIEFSYFFNYDELNESESDYIYLAYLIKNDWEHPKTITLFKQTELLELIKNKSTNNIFAVRGSNAKNNNYNYKDVYNLIWKPLEKELSTIESIYFSPSGLLTNVPFSTLANSKGEILIDKYKLVQLSSTNLVSQQLTEPQMKEIVLIGDIDYEFDISNGKFVKIKRKFDEDSKDYWSLLDGTGDEINNIEKIFKSKSIQVEKCVGGFATEEYVKKMDTKSPSILHIATHGFYFEKNFDFTNNNLVTYRGVSGVDPLLRSGLIMAGANQAWRYNKVPKGVEDGTLCGMEISNLDLSNTDMVVLSACETGLGDIEGSEGVYGLQRAFKMAGVKIIIMSLWEVPDKETAEFMNLFYSNWLSGVKVRDAFSQTQKIMSNKYKDQPEKWAAFVLFE